MAKSVNLQDMFLNQVRKEGVGVSIYLIGGVQLRGNVTGFDSFTILLDSPGKITQLIYKHSVASIVPAKPLKNGNGKCPPQKELSSESEEVVTALAE